MTRFAPGTDLSGIDTLTGLPKGQSRRRSPRRGTVKGSRPRPPMPSPRPPMRGPMPPRRSDGLSSDKERHALLTGDYSFLTTDKGKERGQTGSDSWKKYLR